MSTVDEIAREHGLVSVAYVSSGGYSWAATEVFYDPAAVRFRWYSDSGCSCNYYGESVTGLGDFGDGDRDAAIEALKGAAGHWEGDADPETVARATDKVRDYRPEVTA